MPIAAPLWLLMAILVGCTTDPCTRYVDYMCACHADDTGEGCAELQVTYGDADAGLQDQCAIQLQNQRKKDQADGLTCSGETGTGGA